MTTAEKIEQFLAADAFAVAGASTDRSKYGNKVLRCYQQHDLRAIPLNPKAAEVEGIPAVADIAELPPEVKSISFVTPPNVTEELIPRAAAHGVENIWLQPGAESAAAIRAAEKHGLNVIADGSCILVKLGFSE